MDEAAIYTIHGFSQRALTEFAFLSGQPFQVEGIADDADLWRTALHDWWRRTAYPLDLGRARLLRDALGGPNKRNVVGAPLLSSRSAAARLLPEVQAPDRRPRPGGRAAALSSPVWRRGGARDGDRLARAARQPARA